jgi:hypothetical protein
MLIRRTRSFIENISPSRSWEPAYASRSDGVYGISFLYGTDADRTAKEQNHYEGTFTGLRCHKSFTLLTPDAEMMGRSFMWY